MEDTTLVDSSFSATINAPLEQVDVPSWCFTLPESDYQACSPAHCSAGATTTSDGRRMSINVEEFLGKQGIPWDVFKAARRPISEAHNRPETPLFAKSIERHALNRSVNAVQRSTLAVGRV